MNDEKNITVALAGNPNSGKSTIFNELTGARQHIGNYPGVTVEYKEGFYSHGENKIKVVDLPGTYSLTAYSEEEKVARDFIINEKPDVIVDVLDSSNLERHLYLAVQLMELNVPLVLAFNMSDMAKARGYKFDIDKLSELFGAEIVCTVGNKGAGTRELIDAVLKTARGYVDDPAVCTGGCGQCSCSQANLSKNKKSHSRVFRLQYDAELEREMEKLEKILSKKPVATKYNARWLAVKLFEGDPELLTEIDSENVKGQLEDSRKHIESITGESPEMLIAEGRYGFISGACHEAVRSTIEQKRSTSDIIDAVLTNRVLGLPIFLGLMYFVFWLTFTVGAPPMEWIDAFSGWLAGQVSNLWEPGSSSLLKSLLIDGVIGGVGGVLVFLPNIVLLFLSIAILEDSGYMARVAFIMDKLMHKIGLHGKSFIPLLLGFGCTIPAIMATRTIENKRDRLVTMMVAPLMSCGARLPIYMLIIPAFFPEKMRTPVLWSVYILGLFLAILAAKILRGTVFKGESVPFVMELPTYRLPTIKGLFMHMWERSWLFLRKAGTLILGISILLWAAATFPRLPENVKREFDKERYAVKSLGIQAGAKETRLEAVDENEAEATLEYSAAGRIGKFFEPVFTPLGFDWKLVTPIIGAVAAKEVFVSNLGVIFSVGEADEESEPLKNKLRERYSNLTAVCILIFMLIVAPCMATFAIMKSESNSWKWAAAQSAGLTLLAYILTMLVYQTGSLLGYGAV